MTRAATAALMLMTTMTFANAQQNTSPPSTTGSAVPETYLGTNNSGAPITSTDPTKGNTPTATNTPAANNVPGGVFNDGTPVDPALRGGENDTSPANRR